MEVCELRRCGGLQCRGVDRAVAVETEEDERWLFLGPKASPILQLKIVVELNDRG